MLGDIISWPFRAVISLISFVLSIAISVLLSPIRLLHAIVRSIWNRFRNTLAWIEPKIVYLRSTKPLVYLLPVQLQREQQHQGDSEGEYDGRDLSSIVPSTRPILGLTPGKDKRDLTNRSVFRRRPPTQTHSKAECNEESSSSMTSLIQELLELSKHHKSPTHKAAKPNPQIQESATAVEDESEKVMKLIKDLQEIASSKSKLVTERPNDPATVNGEDTELNQLMSDLNVLELYVSHFLDEQQGGVAGSRPLSADGQSSITDSGSLETITEEELSKECSPSYLGSPSPLPRPTSKQAFLSDDEDDVLHLVPESEELQLLLKQITDTVHQTERNVAEETHRKRPSVSEVATQQFVETKKEFQSVIDSLENQQKFIETQQELQLMMDSLDPSHITAATSPVDKQPHSLVPEQQQHKDVYDSLNPQSPLYTTPNKKIKPTTPLTLHSDTTNTADDEQIYDSIAMDTPVDDTPPPIPMKRTSSDGGTSTSSVEHSPKGERRRRRHSSGGEEEYSCSRHSHHRSRKHRRHSSRRSESHCCCHDDHSPERSCHRHRPRSRERHHHHHRHHRHHHRSRSDSDESQCRRRVPRESSGYESQEAELESPHPHRRVTRSNSDVSATTPKETRRGFLGGLFSKRSTTSLNSLSSRISETGDNYSVSSYKM